MNNLPLTAATLALLPGAGTVTGAILSERLKPAGPFLNFALHLSAGVIIAIVAVDVMPEALRQAPYWLLAVGLLLGGGAYVGIQTLVDYWQAGPGGAGAGAWMVYVASIADLTADGFLIGASSAVALHMALLLAIGQVIADVPSGFSVIGNFRQRGVGRVRRMLLTASFVAVVVVAALAALFLLRGRPPAYKMFALVFAAGLFMLAAIEDMLKEAHANAADNRWSAVVFLIGFVAFLLISSGIG